MKLILFIYFISFIFNNEIKEYTPSYEVYKKIILFSAYMENLINCTKETACIICTNKELVFF